MRRTLSQSILYQGYIVILLHDELYLKYTLHRGDMADSDIS